MGMVAGPRLVAGVANAGGLGVLPIWGRPLENAAALIAAVQAQTTSPFAVNLRADLLQTDHIALALEAGVSLIHLFWGDPTESMPAISVGGGRLIATVGDDDSARQALDAGAVGLIAQGVEAGGHVRSEMPLDTLLESVLEVAQGVPVIAAGGISTPSDVQRVLQRGAAAALLGTRFAATAESDAHDFYKRALVNAGADDTVRTTCFDGLWPDAPHRALRNSTYERWQAAGSPPEGRRPGEGDVILRWGEVAFKRYSMVPPAEHMTGDFEAAVMYAGCGVGRVTDCPPVCDVVAALCSLIDD
jgi:nitronate monooxygenase